MRGEVLVHLKHGHLVLAEDPPELVIGHDFAAVLRVLQVVRADVLPDLAHHLAPGQLKASLAAQVFVTGGDRERCPRPSAQWTALRGTSWQPGGAEMRGLSRV